MLSFFDFFVMFLLAIILIIGFYQFYFWCQRNHQVKPREFNSKIDEWIPLKPIWIWIYSGLYYPMIIFMVLLMKDYRMFNIIVINFFILMCFHMIFFLYFPVHTPASWRAHQNAKPTLSLKFLKYLQTIDKPSNCFPSMHVSVATLTSCHMYFILQDYALSLALFPVLIAISAVYTKQHYFYDLIPGAILGLLAFWIYGFMY